MRISSIIAFVACLLAASPVAAQLLPHEAKSPGGISYWLMPDANAPTATLAFAWRDGVSLLQPGQQALAFVAPRMLMAGAGGETEGIFEEGLRDEQVRLSFSVGSARVLGLLSAPSEKFPRAAERLRQVMASPNYAANSLARVKKSIASDIRQNNENASRLASRALWSLLAGDHPGYALSSSDWTGLLQAITTDDLRQWHKSVLALDNLLVVAVGNLGEAEFGAAIDKGFGGLPAAAAIVGRAPPAPELKGRGRTIVVVHETAQSVILAAGASGWRRGPDEEKLAMANSVFGGGGFASRLTRSIREELGATYGASSGLVSNGPGPYVFAVQTSVANDKVKVALDAIRAQYAGFLRDGITQAEFDDVRDRAINENQTALTKQVSVALALRNALLFHMGSNYLTRFEARMRFITLDDVNAALREDMPKMPLTVVVVAPSAEGLGADCVVDAVEKVGECR